MTLVKVSVENIDSKEKILHEIDMRKSFETNIALICSNFSKPYSENVYGLKIISTNDGKSKHTHISADNFNEIKDGYFLKLVFSLQCYVKRIFDHINDEYKERSFKDLYELSVDSEFIKEIVKTNKHVVLMDFFTNNDLAESEETACLITIVHLMQKQCITNLNHTFLDKIITKIKSGQSPELIKFALSTIHKILSYREANFAQWKEETIKKIAIPDLMSIIKNTKEVDVQYGALLVINALIRSCKGEKKQQFIKEINRRSCKDTVYEKIIAKGNVDKNMARELYIYQTNLLRVSKIKDYIQTQVMSTPYFGYKEPAYYKKMNYIN